jgi:serine/threonine-protein kinase PknK
VAAHAHADRVRSNPFEGFTDVVQVRSGPRANLYFAVEPSTGRQVALKVLSIQDVSDGNLEAFEREAAVLGTLSSHPNIVTLYEAYTIADGRPVLVLERCEASLADRLRREGPLAAPGAVATAIKLAGALETAHGGGVLHRNVHPDNILLPAFGEPALADFGIALLSTSDQGSDLYEFPGVHVAPELLLGGQATPATDVYGLAATLHTLITGAPPLPQYDGESIAARVLRVLRDVPPPVAGAEVPYELTDLLAWALAKDPAARPPSMGWLAEELARIEDHAGWPRTHPYVREPDVPIKVRRGVLRHRPRFGHGKGR